MKTGRCVSCLLFFLFAAGTLAVPAYAQSCALCYTQAASSGARMIEALKSGILILIVPPTLMTIAMIGVLYHKRNQCKRPNSMMEVDGSW